MAFYEFSQNHERIGVVGLTRSGKTVLLTSLIDHLKNFDVDRCNLGKSKSGVPIQIVNFQEIENKGLPRFPYKSFRSGLVEKSVWPEKTHDPHQFRCCFNVSGEKRTRTWDLFDIPGERITDVLMGGNNYGKWSDRILESLESTPETNRALGAYLKVFEEVGSGGEEEIVNAYKFLLAQLLEGYRAHISPSSFLLGVGKQGQPDPSSSLEEMAAAGCIGLDRDEEFAPMPESARKNFPEIAKEFSKRFRRYRSRVPSRVFGQLHRCTQVVILIDILDLLAKGPDVHGDTSDLMDFLMDYLVPTGMRSRFDKLGRGIGNAILPNNWKPGGINRVVFVATQADRASNYHLDEMKNLLKKVFEKKVAARPKLKHDFVVCAGIRSTETCPDSTPDRPRLQGFLMRDEKNRPLPGPKESGAEEKSYEVDPVPESFPEDWDTGDYVFPKVFPVVPANTRIAPEHLQLEQLMRFLLALDRH